MYDNPLVSVCVITYNHYAYIEQCLEGILAQQTSFNVEILVHDDASTDGTVEVLRKYEKNYPDVIRVFYEKENQYQKGTYKCGYTQGLLVPAARGEFIAACEGDDFWTNQNKLQLQVSYLLSHPDCVMACHAATVIDGGTDAKLSIMGMGNEEHDLSSEEIIVSWNVPTASWLYRKSLFASKHNDWPASFPVGDFPSVLYASTAGRVHYFPDELSVYRYQAPGSWTSSMSSETKRANNALRWLEMFETIDRFTDGRFHRAFIEASRPQLRTLLPVSPASNGSEFVKEAVASLHLKDLSIIGIKRLLRLFGYSIEATGFGEDRSHKLVKLNSVDN